MSLKNTVIFWVLAAVGLILFLYVFSGILLPFVGGMAVAYMLDPIADRLQRLGLSRMLATVLIVLLFLMVVVLLMVLIIPVLANQLTGLVARLPESVAWLQSFVVDTAGPRISEMLNMSEDELRSSVGGVLNQGVSWLTELAKQILSGSQAIVSVVSALVITPVVAFYLLLDWDRMVQKVDGWLPRDHADTIRSLAREMDEGVSKFVRGQFSVCLLLGLFYAVTLIIAGLNFGLLIGMGAGLISFIPYIGSFVGGFVAIGVALMQFWPDWTMIAIIAGIFALGQFLEGNILQPKLIGGSVGLHPVWLMFSLFAFATLFGFVGMLIAVPAATAVAVLTRFALAKYMESPLYQGVQPSVVPPPSTGRLPGLAGTPVPGPATSLPLPGPGPKREP
ncbi:AI-2E family transporter [Methylobrevis albus]|uniref:AI-2E family transporter n=1 Tax=Methylobrevis albus TaxID=2793297 RepID=A0A931I620_9HYPH|nr:AI-2E family transporter [Methylobrevis albus]MBH0239941.1 AI-2E family transporter [Methylobrevis albus]